jgi:hypothetical protein
VTRMMKCKMCGLQCEKTGRSQKYCRLCSGLRRLQCNRRWRLANPKAKSPPRIMICLVCKNEFIPKRYTSRQKTCDTKCKKIRTKILFHKLYHKDSYYREKSRLQAQKERRNNPERRSLYGKQWRLANPGKVRANNRRKSKRASLALEIIRQLGIQL